MRINLTTPMSGDEERERHTKAVIDAIEQYTEERMNDEYGKIHTDGSRSGGQPVVDNAMLEALQKDAGLPHLPTQETYQFRMAVSGEGPLAHQWSDKPHRLLYDACSIIEREAALRTYSNVVAAGSDRIGGAGVVPHGVVGVAAQREITQADIDAAESIFWVETIIDDHEAVAKAFARHHQHGYDQGYYDGCAHTMDAWNRRDDALREALEDLLHAVCGEKGFAQAVRRDSGRIYPWPALDLAEAKARKALRQSK